MAESFPTALEIEDSDHLRIDWDDGQKRRYSFRELRDNCPCASCREKRTGEQKQQAEAGRGLLPVLSREEVQPLQIQRMEPVGNYAYSILFSDGHDTGIYTVEFLRLLGTEVSAAEG